LVRRLAKDRIRDVIAALRGKPMTWSELKRQTGTPTSSLNRILKEYLAYWGLVTKTDDGLWQWYEHVKTFESEEVYSAFADHSNALIPGIRAVIFTVEQGRTAGSSLETYIEETCGVKLEQNIIDKLQERFLEHLRTGNRKSMNLYNDLDSLENQETNVRKNNKALAKRILEELIHAIPIPIHPSDRRVLKFYDILCDGIQFTAEKGRYRFIGIVNQIIRYMKTPSTTPQFTYDEEGNKELSWGGHTVARGVSEDESTAIQRIIHKIMAKREHVKDTENLKVIENKVSKLGHDIGDELKDIIAMITMRNVLDGTCDVCRSFNISRNKPSQ